VNLRKDHYKKKTKKFKLFSKKKKKNQKKRTFDENRFL